MTYPATNINEAVALVVSDSNALHDVINGEATETVTLPEGSSVPTLRKAIADSLLFKNPIAWEEGSNNTDYLQLRTFTDNLVYWAPNATGSNPIPMGATPIGDSNWKLSSFNHSHNSLTNRDDANAHPASSISMSNGHSVQRHIDSTGYRVASVEDMIAGRTSSGNVSIVDGSSWHTESFVKGAGMGGGDFIYDASRDKNDHNGGTVIDPDRPYPSDFSDESQVVAWLTKGTGSGCFVKSNHNRSNYDEGKPVFVEEFGVLGGGPYNHLLWQSALDDSTIVCMSHLHRFSYMEGVTVKTVGFRFIGPNMYAGYNGPDISYKGGEGTFGIHVQTFGTSWIGSRFDNDSALNNNLFLFHRNNILTPDGGDLDAYIGLNAFSGFKTTIKAVGRNIFVDKNSFSRYAVGVELEQFTFTEGTPSYSQTIKRGFRRHKICENSFHASSGMSIRNTGDGSENLYDCMICDNQHDTVGFFFLGDIKESLVQSNQISRLGNKHSSLACAFNLGKCYNVDFVGNRIQGETGDTSDGSIDDATMPYHAFVFRTRDVGGVSIVGGGFKNILKSPILHLDPPKGSVSIKGVNADSCAYEVVTLGANMPYLVSIMDTTTSAAMGGYLITDCTMTPEAVTTGEYTYIMGISTPSRSHANINVYGNVLLGGFDFSSSNLQRQTGSLFNVFTYAGDGLASKTIETKSGAQMATVCPLSSSASNRFSSITVSRGLSNAANDALEITLDGDIIAKGDYNQSGIIYQVVIF